MDLAARAAWLYYVGGRTQDEIALRLRVSRQGAQRLVALAVAQGLVKFRLDHRIAGCAALAERLQERFRLGYCDVVPEAGEADAVAISAAERVDACLAGREPVTIALGSGRALRGTVEQVTARARPQHKIVSLIGNLTRDGRAGPYDVVMRLADISGAQCYPLPLPVVVDSAEELATLRGQRAYAVVHDLACAASCHFVGVGHIGPSAPLRREGFITDEELADLVARGGIGEVCGWAFDRDGRLLTGATNDRIAAIPLERPPARPRIGVGAGPAKVAALRAALEGGVLSGLITDEPTAEAVLRL